MTYFDMNKMFFQRILWWNLQKKEGRAHLIFRSSFLLQQKKAEPNRPGPENT